MTYFSGTQRRWIGCAFMALVALTACADKAEDNSAELSTEGAPTIQSERVGALRIGMRIEELGSVGQLLRDTTMDTPDGADSQRAITVVIVKDTVLAFVGSGTVGMIEVRSAGLRTVDDLGVGSRVEAVVERDHASAEVLHGDVWIERPGLCGVYFLASAEGHQTGDSLDSAAVREMAEKTVNRVLITRCSRG